jgi:hypothetical protein
MVAQDSQGFYGHDDLLSLSLFLKILFLIFEALFRTLTSFTFTKNSLIFSNFNYRHFKTIKFKIKTRRIQNFLFRFRASYRCFLSHFLTPPFPPTF